MKLTNFKNSQDVQRTITIVHKAILKMNDDIGIASVVMSFGLVGKTGENLCSEVQINIPDDMRIKRTVAIIMIKAATRMVRDHENKKTIFDSFTKIINEKNNSIQKGKRNQNTPGSNT